MRQKLTKLFLVFTILSIGVIVKAQNGQFDVRFTVKSFDCTNNKVVIQVQVKARDAAHTFLMGDANYRFDYDPRVIKSPVIVRQENFSNVAPASNLNYLPQNLNGSLANTTIGTVSLNTFYGGGGLGAQMVGTNWIPVSCISFDVFDATKCMDLIWHTDTQFPVTGMNEVILPDPVDGSFEYGLVEGGGLFGNYSICIPSVCNGIVALDDINTTFKGIPVTGNFLTNDQSNGGTITPTTTPIKNTTNGTLTINPDGTYTYNPTMGFVGADTAQYRVCNAKGLCDTATLIVTVLDIPNATQNNVPIAQNDNAITNVGVPVTGSVLSNDIDPDGNPLLVNTTPVATPKNGTVVLNPDGTFTYTPNSGFTGQDTLKYAVCDNGTPSKCDTAMVVINVLIDINNTDNDKPNAQDDAFTTTTSTPITSGNVKPNDSDPNTGQTLTFTGVTAPINGIVALNPNGTFTYTPNAGYRGPDKFTYKACDNGTPILCDTATVYLTIVPPINLPPVVPETPQTTLEDTPLTVCLPITDPNAIDTFTVTTCTAPTMGTAVLSVDNSTKKVCLTYTPMANQSGQDVVCFIVCDNGIPSKCDTVNVPIIITPVNDPPVVTEVPKTTPEDEAITICQTITEPDAGDTHTATLCQAPTNGTASTPSVSGGQVCVTYTPNPNFYGTDTLCVIVCDSGSPSKCDTIKVPITVTPVNDPPVVPSVIVDTPNNTPVTNCLPISDVETGDNHTVTVCQALMHGTLVTTVNNATHELCYTLTPAAGYVGKDTACVIVCDNGTPSKCDTVYFLINIRSSNNPPVATNDINNGIENQVLMGNILSNDSDPDSHLLTLTTTPLVAPAHGTIVINPNGSYTYTPTTGFTGTDIIKYKICDNGVPTLCDTGTLQIEIRPAAPTDNQTPVANDDNTSVPSDTPITIPVKANDYDPNSDPLSNPTLAGPAVGGTAMVNPDGTITFTPALGFIGTASVPYSVCDNASPAKCDTATLTVEVYRNTTTGNLPPVAVDDANMTTKNVTVTGNVSTNDTDPNMGQTKTYSLISTTPNGNLTINANGTYTYVPNTDFVGTDVFKYKICDNGSPVMCDTAYTYITVFQNPCVTINLKVLLEGPFQSITNKMTTILNQRGLLPGQTPIGQFAVATVNGQPYKGAPWNYPGTEGDTITTYPSTVTDWVLVSLRTTTAVASTVYRAAAWLHNDGTVEFINPCFNIPASGSFYVVVEHRNHIGVMSPTALTVTNGKIIFDFTAANSYIVTDPPSFGQKQIGSKWVMFTGDSKKNTQTTNFDVNFQDFQLWKGISGIFDQYKLGDYNLDADNNYFDQVLWKGNSGIYSGVPH
jgi:hypothetical protein